MAPTSGVPKFPKVTGAGSALDPAVVLGQLLRQMKSGLGQAYLVIPHTSYYL